MSNSLEVNKIFAAVLTAGVTFGLAGLVGRLVVHPTTPKPLWPLPPLRRL